MWNRIPQADPNDASYRDAYVNHFTNVWRDWLLATTLIVWMGEFGRTPKFGQPDGRDHWPNSFCAVLAGGGIKGGQVIGATDPSGAVIKDRPVTAPEFLATVVRALGLDPTTQNISNTGRPIPLVEKSAKPIKEVLA